MNSPISFKQIESEFKNFPKNFSFKIASLVNSNIYRRNNTISAQIHSEIPRKENTSLLIL